MTEAELLAEVTGLCYYLGLPWFHRTDLPNSSRGKPGFPDLVIVGTKVLFAELKSEGGDTSADQDLWLWHLDRAAALLVIWRPSDLEAGRIEDLLSRIS